MTTQPDNDSTSPEEYARRLKSGDEIFYLPEAAVFVRKSLGTLRYYRHLDAVGVNEVSHAIVVLARHPRAPRYSVTLAVKTLHTVSARVNWHFNP